MIDFATCKASIYHPILVLLESDQDLPQKEEEKNIEKRVLQLQTETHERHENVEVQNGHLF
jgi:hypothetical protein